ncbi:hypothetical protein BGC07_15305 [Piscirickettsia litoralis]|uniref:3-deoxy-D-manno-octulosonic acid transferase n=1 Tax=Piscirickettsia litoralis TaxID=1891921 RepID=A0ABX3A262_9GAMM|nr:hypothetical protein BGC07_15305 [Piscirickettsia litoralis]
MVETEIWPNLLEVCRTKKVKVCLTNARLSERSYKKYKKFGDLSKNLLSRIDKIISQSDRDSSNFINLGYPSTQISTSGSIKYDLAPDPALIEKGKMLYQNSWNNSIVVCAASTHDGEEKIILSAFEEIKASNKSVKLIIVPRHPGRFNDVYELSKKYSQNVVKKSQASINDLKEAEILVGDTMGEMTLYLSMANISFVGGSLVKIGGHNLLEPASLKVPIITGRYLYNFKEISENLIKASALEVVSNEQELLIAMNNLIDSKDLRLSMLEAGYRVYAQNKGALYKQLTTIETLLPKIAWGF